MLKNIFSPNFYHQNRENAEKCTQKLGARERRNAGIREASPFLYLQCSLPSALNSPVSSPTFSGFSSR